MQAFNFFIKATTTCVEFWRSVGRQKKKATSSVGFEPHKTDENGRRDVSPSFFVSFCFEPASKPAGCFVFLVGDRPFAKIQHVGMAINKLVNAEINQRRTLHENNPPPPAVEFFGYCAHTESSRLSSTIFPPSLPYLLP